MYSKPHFVYEKKTVFIYFLTISGIIHLILIFSSSSLSHLLKPALNFSDYAPKKSNYVVEIDLVPKKEEESIQNEEESKEEVEADKEDLPEEKRQLFVDTSGKAIDEEPQTDTSRIGEKGSIARDMYSGDDNINDEPRLESDTDFPGEVPDALSSTMLQESGFPIDGSFSEPAENVMEKTTQPVVGEQTVDSLPGESNKEALPDNDEVESFDEIQDESVVQDVKAVDIEETSSQTMKSPDAGLIDNIDEITTAILDPGVVVPEAESMENVESETDVAEHETEEITEHVEEYTKTASIPRTMIKEIVDGSRDSILKELQVDATTSESQTNNMPVGDDAPFFEDDISNAPETGTESFNVKKHEYAAYYKHIKDKIRLYWLLQYGTDASINQVTDDYKPIIVTFKALPSGKIVKVVIVDPAGNELLASKIQISIRNTILNKFPDYIDDKYINVKFSYYFF